MLFNSFQKLFLFSRKSNLSILDFQISWHHQMPKHKTRNTFYWICYITRLCHIPKETISSKNSTKNATWKLVPGPCVYKELTTSSIGKWNFWSNLLYQICNSKAIEISPNQHAGVLRVLFTEDSLKLKWAWN